MIGLQNNNMSLIIAANISTPEVHFSSDTGILKICGKCYPENSKKFFVELTEWIDAWTIDKDVKMDLEIDYISSAATIGLIRLIKLIAAKSDYALVVCWKYEDGDEEGQRTGEAIQEACEIAFEFIQI